MEQYYTKFSFFFLLITLFTLNHYGNSNSTKPLVPTEIIQSQIHPYSPDEQEAILTDYTIIEDLSFKKISRTQKIYIGTAGAPGSSKTTILETYLKDHNISAVYIDPDQRALKFMVNTYLSDLNAYNISKYDSYQHLLKSTYEKWRDASNYIANSLLNKAFQEGCPIAHGTTATTPHIEKFYQSLKSEGYKIILLICISSLENCKKAIAHRAHSQCFIQTTDEDISDKYTLFSNHLNNKIYQKYADEIYYYQIEDFSNGWNKVDSITTCH